MKQVKKETKKEEDGTGGRGGGERKINEQNVAGPRQE